jgi:hypothetical protein
VVSRGKALRQVKANLAPKHAGERVARVVVVLLCAVVPKYLGAGLGTVFSGCCAIGFGFNYSMVKSIFSSVVRLPVLVVEVKHSGPSDLAAAPEHRALPS